MEQFKHLACPLGLCNNETIQGGSKTTRVRTNEEREIHSVDCNFFDMLFDKMYEPMNIISVNNKTRKNRS